MLLRLLVYSIIHTLSSTFVNSLRPSTEDSIISASKNTSLTARSRITCDAQRHGYDPDTADCRDALGQIPVIRSRVTFMDREIVPPGPHRSENIMPLPFRVTGKGARCYIQIILTGTATVGVASVSEIDDAASELISTCALRESSGGLATNIGSQPSIRCRGEILIWESCPVILYSMEASTKSDVFGLKSDPRSEIVLPAIVTSDHGLCEMRIFTTGASDTASWYQFWEATSALYYACAKQGKGGVFSGLGDAHRLFVVLTGTAGLSGGSENVTMETLKKNASLSVAEQILVS